jgi:hypothetical protein
MNRPLLTMVDSAADHCQVTSGMVVVSAEYVQVKTRLLLGKIFADGLLH